MTHYATPFPSNVPVTPQVTLCVFCSSSFSHQAARMDPRNPQLSQQRGGQAAPMPPQGPQRYAARGDKKAGGIEVHSPHPAPSCEYAESYRHWCCPHTFWALPLAIPILLSWRGTSQGNSEQEATNLWTWNSSQPDVDVGLAHVTVGYKYVPHSPTYPHTSER